MARPSKYNPELLSQIVGYISDGLTVRDACFGAGISEDTFWRWNREKVEFAEAIKRATTRQKWSSEALARTSEYRRYTRKAQICSRKPTKSQNHTRYHPNLQNAQKQALAASEDVSVHTFGEQNLTSSNELPTRSEPPTNAFGELIPTNPYYNPTSQKVEWVEKELYGRCVLHRCELAVWRERRNRAFCLDF